VRKPGPRLVAATGLALLGAAGWELQRRSDLRAVDADPAWQELSRPIAGRSRAVRSRDGTRLHVEVFGDDTAPPLVLVHGWTFAIAAWHYQIRDLSSRFRVIAYDQRGHGRSAVPEDAAAYTEQALAADLDAVLDACLRPDERFVIAGHSMGGMTIVAWAAAQPDRAQHVAAAALVNTGMHDMVSQLLVLGPSAGARAHHLLVAPLQRAGARLPARLTPLSYRAVRRVVASPSASPGRVAFLHQLIVECPAPVRSGFGQLLAGLDLSQAVRHLNAPTLVIAGELDRLLPPWHSEQLAANLPNLVELAVLDGVGHVAPIEAEQAVSDRLAALAATTLAAPAGRSVAVAYPGSVAPLMGGEQAFLH